MTPLYVHRLAVTHAHSGRSIDALVLNFAGDYTYDYQRTAVASPTARAGKLLQDRQCSTYMS